MPGRLQRNFIRDGLRRGVYPIPRARFRPLVTARRSDRVECVLCGDRGYGPLQPTALDASPWQLIHMLDHPYECEHCSMRFVSGGRQAGHLGQVHGRV